MSRPDKDDRRDMPIYLRGSDGEGSSATAALGEGGDEYLNFWDGECAGHTGFWSIEYPKEVTPTMRLHTLSCSHSCTPTNQSVGCELQRCKQKVGCCVCGPPQTSRLDQPLQRPTGSRSGLSLESSTSCTFAPRSGVSYQQKKGGTSEIPPSYVQRRTAPQVSWRYRELRRWERPSPAMVLIRVQTASARAG